MHSSVPEFLRTFKKKKRTRPVTSGYIKKCKSLKDVQPSKRIRAEMQNDMKSPALLANFISGGHAFNDVKMQLF